MNDLVIRTNQLSKEYELGSGVLPGWGLRHAVEHAAGAPIRALQRWRRGGAADVERRQGAERFLALDDVSFDVRRGEVVGVIGGNGAGKSTLLKILSRITEPTKGSVGINGRVGSLLEVGTGFHPELTGRENIFLNGAILGMSHTEVRRKLDEIVAFAEVERFLETPVKRYSSGMYVRLAFAVAAHLEPEVLVVDEVLAVGDAAFQAKCLAKMDDSAGHGRTILFVSHNMQAIRQLCTRCLVLRRGRVLADGDPSEAIRTYLQDGAETADGSRVQDVIATLPEDPVFRLRRVAMSQGGFAVTQRVVNGEPLAIEIEYDVKERQVGLRVYLDLRDQDGALLFRTFHDESANVITSIDAGRYTSVATIPRDLLAPATYELRIGASLFERRACVPVDGLPILIRVERTGRANAGYVADPIRGKLAPVIPWTNAAAVTDGEPASAGSGVRGN